MKSIAAFSGPHEISWRVLQHPGSQCRPFFLSDALFPLNDPSKPIKLIAGINSLSYDMNGIREMLTAQTHFRIGMDMLVLSVATTLLLTIGNYLF